MRRRHGICIPSCRLMARLEINIAFPDLLYDFCLPYEFGFSWRPLLSKRCPNARKCFRLGLETSQLGRGWTNGRRRFRIQIKFLPAYSPAELQLAVSHSFGRHCSPLQHRLHPYLPTRYEVDLPANLCSPVWLVPQLSWPVVTWRGQQKRG